MEKCLELKRVFSIREELPGYLLFRKLGLFRGPENPRALVASLIEAESARMVLKQNGNPFGMSSRETRARLIRCINNYFSLILQITQYVCHSVDRGFPDQNLRIVQVRVKFDFRSWLLKLLFIIDADREAEDYFLQLMNEIEKYVLLDECFVPSLLYVNKREGIMDNSSIRGEYPYVVDVKART
jgi:hypothetical protein